MPSGIMERSGSSGGKGSCVSPRRCGEGGGVFPQRAIAQSWLDGRDDWFRRAVLCESEAICCLGDEAGLLILQ